MKGDLEGGVADPLEDMDYIFVWLFELFWWGYAHSEACRVNIP